MKIIHWLFALCLLTSSFDIFLVFNAGGTVRFAQLVMVLVCLGALAKAAQEARFDLPAGGGWLVLWWLVQVIFLPFSVDLDFSTKYLIFLTYTLVCYFAVIYLYGKSGYIRQLMKAYLWSYVFVAAFGIFQMVTPALHLGSYLVTQWIVHDRFARINGFCYEPSYYATYMLPGWILMLDLRYSRARLTAAPKWRWLTILVGTALFLSTSKTAWGFMMLEGAARTLPVVLRWARSLQQRLEAGRLVVRIPRLPMLLAAVVGIVFVVAGLKTLSLALDLNIFLAGTGINNTAAHSVNTRRDQFLETVDVFKEHPMLGRSLGGVSSRISEKHGVPNDGKTYLGFPVMMELLAASGIIGIIPFLLFLWTNSLGLIPAIRRHWPDENAKWLRALLRSTIYLWLVLVVDQNVLRIYLWFHMSIVAVVAMHLASAPASHGQTDFERTLAPA
jgi:hypothetical protein